MFVGRIGPLVVALAISRRTTARFYYADENIIVG
jgi:trk system potassium uptake protein TrkH